MRLIRLMNRFVFWLLPVVFVGWTTVSGQDTDLATSFLSEPCHKDACCGCGISLSTFTILITPGVRIQV
ncbi:hypothetical protein RUM44_000481 [Polyplax serrata]|uniref:Uncharacterized protein n=1 Tax=Polyplax serrata TaxID=468196 RepID=A0ABR1B5J4_POLSC